MRSRPQTRTFLGLVAVALLGGVALNIWAFIEWTDQESAAVESAQRLADCLQISDHIQQLRGRPAVAGDSASASTEITPQIETGARRSGIGPKDLVRITPEPPHRLGDSPYLEQSTEMVLEGVTLRQCVDLLHAVSTGRRGLRVKEIRLTAPPASEVAGLSNAPSATPLAGNGSGPDRWTLEATVSALSFSPVESRNRTAGGDR